MDHFHNFDTDRRMPAGLNPVPEALTFLRRIPVARRVDTSVYCRVDIGFAVPVDTGLVRHPVHTDPEHHTGSLLVGPDREHLDEEIGFRSAAMEVAVDSAVSAVAVVHRLATVDQVPFAAGAAANSPVSRREDNHRQRHHPDRYRSHPSMRYCFPALGTSLASWMIPETGPKWFCSISSWNLLRPGQ